MSDTPEPGRLFDDFTKARTGVYDQVLSAAQTIKPVEYGGRRVEVLDVGYDPADDDDDENERFGFDSQAKAVRDRTTLGRRLRATVRMSDLATGNVLEEQRKLMAVVPRVNEDGTMIYRGSRYNVVNQQRLKPAVYGRVKKNEELEVMANPSPGSGSTHRYIFNPESSVFFLSSRNSKVPLVPLLRALGVEDDAIRAAWGDEIAEKNFAKRDGGSLDKLYERLVPKKLQEPHATPEFKQIALRQAIGTIKLDPWSTKKILGIETDHLTPEVILRSTAKTLEMSRGLSQGDDRDSLAFQTVHGVEDLMAERFRLDSGHHQKNSLRKALWRGNLKALPAKFLQPHIESTIFGSGLGIMPEYANPLDAWDRASRVTKLGEGGIASTDSVPMESRDHHASHQGFIDPARTAESTKVGIDVNFAAGARKGPDGKVYTQLINARTGELEFVTPERASEAVVAFQAHDKEVPGYMLANVRGGERFVKPSRVDYIQPDSERSAFSTLSNLTPMKGLQPQNRTAMSARFSLAGDSQILIQRASGEVYCGSIADYEWRVGDLGLTIDKTTCQQYWGPVRAKYRHKLKVPMWEVSLKSGRSVVATHDHSFVTIGSDGRLVEIHSQDMQPGVAVPRALSYSLPITYTGDWVVLDGNKHNARPGMRFELDRELGWIHGRYLADGHYLDGLSALSLGHRRADVSQIAVDFFAKCGVEARIATDRDGLIKDVVVGWKQFGVSLRATFGFGSYGKYIPGWVFAAPVAYREGLLAGYMAGDSSVYQPRGKRAQRFTSTSKSKRLRDGIVTLLSMFGIDTTITETMGRKTAKTKATCSYRLSVVSEHVAKLPITGNAAKDKLIAANNYTGAKGCEPFPVWRSLKEAVRSKTNRGDNYRKRLQAGHRVRETIIDVLGESGDEYWHRWLASAVRWDRVASLEEVDASRHEYVYDLDMGDNVFSTQSGVYVHNTTQAVPLKNREAPWVQVAVPGTDRNESFEQHYADRVGLRRAPAGGQVVAVKPNAIQIETPDGIRTVGLHVNTPLGRKTNLVNTPIVQVGDRVEPGQPLATSNYTDQSGTMALGLNARVAYTPWGDNYEDAYTISQSFANRMASEHSYEFRRDNDPESRTSVNDYISALPREYNREQVERMDPDGVVRVGTVVKQGDPLVLSAKRRSANLSKRVSRTGAISFTDDSQQWSHDDPGIVTNVHRTKNGGAVVTVATASPLRDADKLAERAGNKGIVRIIPDDEMLQDQNGQPFDVVASDLGLISRKNDSRAYEALLGKIAAKTGKPYRLEEMDSNDIWQLVRDGLDQNGLSDTETVVDPTSGRKIPNVFTGVQYMLKLQHMAESKAHGRGVGAYSSDGQPAKGAEEGLQAKRFSSQELGAMVSHGAFQHLKEVALVRGQRNDEYWARFINGHDLPEPKVPMVYNKFLAYLKGMGVNPVRTGTKTKLLLLDDKGTGELAEGRTVRTGETVNMAKDLKPAPGGLFDPALFGGDGDKFASYELDEPIPHPMMEDALRTLMGVTKDGFRSILSGQQPFGQHGTGPQAIQSWLAKLNPANELAAARLMASDPRKTKREEAIKKMRYLAGLTSRNIQPESLMIRQVPIIPPIFRPISRLDNNNTPLIDGMNLLYRDMIAADENHRKVKQFSSDTSNERLGVYDAVQAAVGLRQPLDPELERKSVTGIMARLVGKGGPKSSFVSRKLLSGTVDSVGRAVIGPDAKLGLDEVGIPEEQAWSIYEAPILRNMTRRGVALAEARESVKRRDKAARQAMEEELSHRPVMVSRAPVLHKYGAMTFWPKLVKGTSLHMNPLVYSGYGADNDGDAVNFHALITEEAIREAKQKTMPSRSLISPKDFKRPMFVPGQDHALGIYLASTAADDDERLHVFADRDAARRAFRRGEISVSSKIKILG